MLSIEKSTITYLDLPELDLDVLKEAVLTRDELRLQRFNLILHFPEAVLYCVSKLTLATPSQRDLGVRGFSPPENTFRLVKFSNEVYMRFH